MNRFKRILVDIDSFALAHPAMERASELARACGAALKIVDVVPVPPDARKYMSRATEDLLVNSRRDRLAAISRTVDGASVEIDVLKGRPAIALIREVLRSGHDLVIRSHARDLVSRKNFGAVDMELFRQCPCPVWAVGPGAATRPRQVLAAVHANPDEPEEDALNKKIIETALMIADVTSANVVVFQAWTAFGEEVLRSHAKPDDLSAYAANAERTAREGLTLLVDSFGNRLSSANVELRKGYPEDIVPALVVDEGIDLVVMGTIARTGVAGFLIGNTAERLLQRLFCSVLAVKPDGFTTPVRMED